MATYDLSHIPELRDLQDLANRQKARDEALKARVKALENKGGQANVIETIKVNGQAQAVNAKAVDITGLGIPGTNTTYSPMSGATSSAAGTNGLVPAPPAGAQGKFLRGDGTWQPLVSYGEATATNAGLMSAADKTKLDGLVLATSAEVKAMLDEVFAEA